MQWFCIAAIGQTPTPTDRDRISAIASQALSEGTDLLEQGTIEAVKAARGKFKIAKNACEQMDDLECAATGVFFLGRVSDLLGENTDALGDYGAALTIFQTLKNPQAQMGVLNNIGLVYSNMGDFSNAVTNFEAALEINRTVKDGILEGTIRNNLGKTYYDMREIAKAVEYLNSAAVICTEEKNDLCLANAVLSLGAIANADGENGKALEYYGRALKLSSSLGDKRLEGTIFANIGKVNADLGEAAKADENLNKAVDICHATGFKICEASALNSLGEVRSRDGRTVMALEYFDRSIDVSRAAKNKSFEATALINKAYLSIRTNDHKQAVRILEPVIQIVSELKLTDLEALMYGILATSQNNSGEPAKAIVSADRCAAIVDKVENRRYRSVALYSIGIVYAQLGQTRKALDYLTRSLPLARGVGDKSTLAVTLNYLGGLNLQFGKTAIAIENANEALALSRVIHDTGDEILALIVLGRAHSLSDPTAAIDNLIKALALAESIGEKSSQALVLARLGEIYYVLGQPKRSFEYLNRALPLAKSGDDKVVEFTAYNLLGLAYSAFGQHQKGFEYINLALSTARSINYKAAEAVAFNSLGKLSIATGDPEKAMGFLNDAIAIARDLGDKGTEAIALGNLGGAYFLRDDKEKGSRFYEQSRKLYHEIGDRGGEVVVLTDLGFFSLKSADYEQAARYFRQALAINNEYKYKAAQALLLANMMVAANSTNSPQLAILHGKQAVNIYQEVRAEVQSVDESLQKTYLRSIDGVYRYLADLLIAQGRISEAEQVLGMLKEEETFAYLRREDKVARSLMQGVDLSEKERESIKQYDALGDKMTSLAKEFGDLDQERAKYDDGKFPNQARYDELRSQIADANTTFQKFLDDLKITFGKRDERIVSVDSSLQNTLKRLKATRIAVVSTIVGESRLNLIVTTAGTQRAHTVDVPEKDINTLVAEFRKALTNPKLDPRPAGQKLYNILVKPIEADLKGIDADTILWSLDGTLRYLPTAALWDKDKGYLAERFASVVLTLASRDTLMLPVTGKENWTALGVGVSKATEGFVALKAVPDELDCIITDAVGTAVSLKPVCQSGVIKGKKLLDDKFTLSAFENALPRFPIVHIASHFSLNPGNDKDSFLLLGGGEQKRFTVEDLRSLSLTDVELIVLSACNTATPGGEKTNGVEIEGFGAAAQKQGAKAVMATLWSVADDSTREWMVKFYQTYEKTETSKAEAMRRTQIAMMYGKYAPAEGNTRRSFDAFTLTDPTQPTFNTDPNAPYAHPYYWSPFVLFGNWK